jgi:acyl-homoserine lactone acylase PvdQ
VQTGSPTTQGRLHATDITYPKFSHAWVVGGSALRGGSTALHTDPQTAVFAPSFGHEMHVVGETFDVRGLTFPGSPGFLVGYTPYVAWGVTAMGLDQEDTFRLDSSPAGWGYRYDGEWKLVETRNEWIRVRTETGFDELPIQVRWTDMGPEVTELLDDVQPGEHYVLSAVPLVDTDRHTIQALLAMMSARSASEFAEATHDWRSPSVHCVYGDVDGAVGYAALAAVPIRSPDTCLGGTSSQDGSLSSLAWQGFIPADLLPALSLPDGGAISSANNIPVGPWYPIPLHLGTGGSGDSRRSWRLRERLTMAPGGQPFTPSQVLAVHRDDVNPVRRAIVGTALFLREQVPTIFSGGANRALDALESWFEAGAHSSLDEPNFALAWHLYTKFRMDDWPDLVPIWGSNNLTHMLKDFERRTEAHTHEPAEFSIDEVAFLNYALATAWHDVRLRYGGTPRQWQAGIQAVLGRVRVRYFSTLEGFGSIDPDQDVIVTGFTTPDGGTLSNQRGQAFSLFTHLARTDTSVGLNPIGGSEHVQSPDFEVAVDDWADGVLRGAGLTVEPFEVAETTVLDWSGP